MKFSITQRFSVYDEFEKVHKIAQVAYTDAPEWVDSLVSLVLVNDIRLALDRYAVPLLLQVRYYPKQCLDRVPNRRCHLWGPGCFGWHEKKCQDLRNNACDLLRIVDANDEHSPELTELINLWRDGYIAVRVANKNGGSE